MLNTFIKTKGITKTLIHNNNKNYINELNWDADYDGEKANISLDIDENGTKGHLNMKMNNDELAELLNIPSENTMLDERLYNDFFRNSPNNEYKIIEIEELPKSTMNNKFHLLKDSFEKHKKKVHFVNENPMADDAEAIYTHISSPQPEEEIIFPLVIRDTRTRKHRSHKKPKSHITYKVYRKNKSSTSSHRSRPMSHNIHSSKKTLRRHKHHGHSRRTF
jgi:hypothetical protein